MKKKILKKEIPGFVSYIWTAFVLSALFTGLHEVTNEFVWQSNTVELDVGHVLTHVVTNND